MGQVRILLILPLNIYIYSEFVFVYINERHWTYALLVQQRTFLRRIVFILFIIYHDNKVHRANIGPIWGRQDPGGPHVGHMNFVIWVYVVYWFKFNVHKHKEYTFPTQKD